MAKLHSTQTYSTQLLCSRSKEGAAESRLVPAHGACEEENAMLKHHDRGITDQYSVFLAKQGRVLL